MNRHVLSCGCPVIVAHREGVVPVTCPGGGARWGLHDARRCPGGIKHEVTAEEVTTVRYESRILDPKGAA